MIAHASRILFAAHSPHAGGAEYCLDTTLRHLDRSRFEPIVVFPFDGPMANSARGLGAEVIIAPMCHWLCFRKDAWYWRNLISRTTLNVARLVRLIRRRGVDLVYTNTGAIFEPALAARRAGVPHIWHVHEVLRTGADLQQLLPLRTTKRLIHRWSDRIVFESQAARRVFEEDAPSDKSEVVYNSLRLSPTNRACNDLRSRLGLGESDFVVGFVGQLIERKNPLLLAETLARLKHLTGIRVLFVGSGPLREKLIHRIAQLGLSDLCRVIEFQEDVSVAMAAIDVLALPSREESFGLVLLEAAAFQKPSIACDSEGPREVIEDGCTGLLVPQDDPILFAAAVQRLFRAPSECVRMGRSAAERAAKCFDAGRNTLLLEQLIDRESRYSEARSGAGHRSHSESAGAAPP